MILVKNMLINVYNMSNIVCIKSKCLIYYRLIIIINTDCFYFKIIYKTKIMAPGPITSWQIDGERMETMRGFILGGLQNHCRW